MIGISTKENDEKVTQDTQKKRHRLRQEFWEGALEQLRADGVDLFRNISPSRDHWLNAGSGLRGCPYTLIFSKDEARVELGLSRHSAADNKWLFDQLFAEKEKLEADFGAQLDWLRLDEKKACRIVYAQEFDGYDRENWPAMVAWLSEHVRKLENAFSGPLERFRTKLRQVGREEI
jgi:hypothetical protein